MDNLNLIVERLNAVASDVSFLRQLVFLQRAQIEALQDFASGHIADLASIDRSRTRKDLNKLVRTKYDAIILKLGDTSPEVAEDADIRSGLDKKIQDQWMFPEGE